MTPEQRVKNFLGENSGETHEHLLVALVEQVERDAEETRRRALDLCRRMADIIVAEFSYDGHDRRGVKAYQELVDQADALEKP